MPSIYDFAPAPPSTTEESEPSRRSKRRELSATDLRSGKRTLTQMVEIAFQALEEAMLTADHPTAVRAAQIVLDRAGFGPKTSLDLNVSNSDLSDLSSTELAQRAEAILASLRPTGTTGTVN